jgi:hypothetical protein
MINFPCTVERFCGLTPAAGKRSAASRVGRRQAAFAKAQANRPARARAINHLSLTVNH